MPLSNEDKALFSDLEVTYNSPGWARLKQGWQEEMDNLPEAAFFNCKTLEDLHTYRVRYGLLKELVELPEDMEEARLALMEDKDESEHV